MRIRGRWGRDALIAMLAALSLALIATSYAQAQRAENLAIQVSAAYHRALYEATELLGGVQLGLEKLSVATDAEVRQELLTDIARQAEAAGDDLAALPRQEETLRGALKFVNQAGDFADSLSRRLSGGGTMTADDAALIAQMRSACAQLVRRLGELTEGYERGEVTFEAKDLKLPEKAREQQSEQIVQYPVLLYDGPFSDGRQTGEMKLAGEAADEGEALRALTRYLGEERIRRALYLGRREAFGGLHEFELETESGRIEAGVTVTGAHVLYLLPETSEEEALLSEAECIDLGERFLTGKGYGPVAVSFWQRQGGILTVNYAATQEGMILYPDLIKLQISMRSGLVVGLDASGYLRNHSVRALGAPRVSEEEAMQTLPPEMIISQVRRCVIPRDEGEAQCWEVTAAFEDGGQYLIYLDADTGRQESILEVVTGADGILAQ